MLVNGICGKDGTNLQWKLDTLKGVLSISGQGEMYDEWSFLDREVWRSKEYKDVITKVVISVGVTSITSHAFEECMNLREIVIPNSINLIGAAAFQFCRKLECITIPDGVEGILANTFLDCNGLKIIKLPDIFKYDIGNCAFMGCSNLESINIPQGVTEIGEDAFKDCSSLTHIKIPEGVKVIGDGAFARCSNLTSIKLPSSLRVIRNNAFYECNKLREAIYQGGVIAWSDVSITLKFCTFFTPKKCTGTTVVFLLVNHLFLLICNFLQLSL